MMSEEDGDDAGTAPESSFLLSFSGASFFCQKNLYKNENCSNFLAFVFYIFSITRLI